MKNIISKDDMSAVVVGLRRAGFSKDEWEFVLHAINQHDGLVAMLKKLEWCTEHDESEQFLEACPCCGQAPKWHASGCELAALLKEEKP